ncbi:MAG: flagellar hook-length control protein FliK [Lachnospiraceae bacterium]|nr:flagellar hook-length control protein FliK [Lachnospiraceae bacterium]
MNLGNIFQSGNRNIKNTETIQTNAATSVDHHNRVPAEIKSYAPGQTIQGEVTGKDGNTVQIAIDKDMVIVARLERDLNIALGQNMSFEIKSNNGSVISLTPLYANMANEATILKALSAAGLSQNAENIRMVSDMMQEGMAINRESIAQVNRQLVDFPQANPSSVIQMIRLGLPITELTVEQFEQYKNYNYQMLGSIDQIMNELPMTGISLLEEGQDAKAVAFFEQILNVFTTMSSKAGEAENSMAKAEIQTEQGPGGADGVTGQNVIKSSGSQDTVLLNEAIQDMGTQNAEAQGTSQQEQAETFLKMTMPVHGQEEALVEAENRLADMMHKLGADESFVTMVKSGQYTAKEVLTQLGELFAKWESQPLWEEQKTALREFAGSKEFQNLLKSEIANQWLLTPEDVAEKEKVEQLYERLRQQTAKINEALQMAGKGDTPAAKSVQNLQSNVEFMNQMNHLFTYVQFPLKMAGNQAHGDLYVYTNKKSLAKKDGNVSALLHLDMEHLGPLDVYVTMQQNKVNTNFTVQDESALDLIEEHIHLLDERLAKRGYSMKANFQLKEDDGKTNVMQEILEQSKNISVLSHTSFDMRA